MKKATKREKENELRLERARLMKRMKEIRMQLNNDRDKANALKRRDIENILDGFHITYEQFERIRWTLNRSVDSMLDGSDDPGK